jgi:hypothetical protein
VRRDRTAGENRLRSWQYLSCHPCVDCQESDPVVLEFDHVGEKRADVSQMISNAYAWSTVELEIARCEVRASTATYGRPPGNSASTIRSSPS